MPTNSRRKKLRQTSFRARLKIGTYISKRVMANVYVPLNQSWHGLECLTILAIKIYRDSGLSRTVKSRGVVGDERCSLGHKAVMVLLLYAKGMSPQTRHQHITVRDVRYVISCAVFKLSDRPSVCILSRNQAIRSPSSYGIIHSSIKNLLCPKYFG